MSVSALTAPNPFEMPRIDRTGSRTASGCSSRSDAKATAAPSLCGRGAGGSPAPRGDHLRPCAAHASAYAAVQIWSIVYRPSATTVSLMLSTVTATGFSRKDGTAAPLAVSAVVSALGDSPLASATASSAAWYASGLNAL